MLNRSVLSIVISAALTISLLVMASGNEQVPAKQDTTHVYSGETEIVQIAVVTNSEKASSPCGACRQVLVDFALESKVYLNNCKDDTRSTTTKALLPDYFSKVDLLKNI